MNINAHKCALSAHLFALKIHEYNCEIIANITVIFSEYERIFSGVNAHLFVNYSYSWKPYFKLILNGKEGDYRQICAKTLLTELLYPHIQTFVPPLITKSRDSRVVLLDTVGWSS